MAARMAKFTDPILALDLATVTGWAWGKPGAKPTFGSQRFGKTGAARAEIYRQYRLWLALMCSTHNIKLIVFESAAVPSFMIGKTNVDTTKFLFGLTEHLEEWAYRQVELREASVAQVRSHFIGQNFKRDVARPLIKEQCHARGWMAETDDECDALALLDYMVCCIRPDIGATSGPLFKGR